MKRSTGERLRVSHERPCTRIVSDSKVTEHYSAVTKMEKLARRNAEEDGRTVY